MKLEYEELTYKIRGAIFDVYHSLGPGFKEVVYHNALEQEIQNKDIRCESKKRIRISYKGKTVGTYEPDFVVEDKVIIELKAVDVMPKIYEQQLFSYLKATVYKVGLLVNFGGPRILIKRRILG